MTTVRMKNNPEARRKLEVVGECGQKEGELNSIVRSQGQGQEILGRARGVNGNG